MFKVESVAKSYGSLQVLENLSLDFPEGKITVIMGPSGCGKTTLLNILAGLVRVDRGDVGISSEVSYFFQEPRLLPWLTVRNNIALVLQDKMPPEAVRDKVVQFLQATGLTGYENFYPAQLSGGMRQRVAMARAFSYQAPLLLMDEPFKSLDLKTRFQLIKDFLRIWLKQPRTVITVTHEVKEAVLLGDKIVVLTDKPARVAREFRIEVPQEERWAGQEGWVMEKELWELLLD